MQKGHIVWGGHWTLGLSVVCSMRVLITWKMMRQIERTRNCCLAIRCRFDRSFHGLIYLLSDEQRFQDARLLSLSNISGILLSYIQDIYSQWSFRHLYIDSNDFKIIRSTASRHSAYEVPDIGHSKQIRTYVYIAAGSIAPYQSSQNTIFVSTQFRSEFSQDYGFSAER